MKFQSIAVITLMCVWNVTSIPTRSVKRTPSTAKRGAQRRSALLNDPNVMVVQKSVASIDTSLTKANTPPQPTDKPVIVVNEENGQEISCVKKFIEGLGWAFPRVCSASVGVGASVLASMYGADRVATAVVVSLTVGVADQVAKQVWNTTTTAIGNIDKERLGTASENFLDALGPI